MHGLRLDSPCFKGKTNLGIREIVNCLAPEISDLYCVTHQWPFLMYSVDGESCSESEMRRLDYEFSQALVEELNRFEREVIDLKLFRPGFLLKFRDYLYGDWNRFYLLNSRIRLETVRPWGNEIPPACQVLICCVDAAYWEVFVRDSALLKRLQDTFPQAVSCLLQDKTT